MPYGELSRQGVQRFATYADLDRHRCTIEEREEYEPHLDRGTIVYAGVDYAEIPRRRREGGEVIVWDGGNNDLLVLQAPTSRSWSRIPTVRGTSDAITRARPTSARGT
jgi:predicted GTPase